MNKKSLLLVLAGYVLWGVLPLYWGLLSNLNSMVILANRVLWSAVWTGLLLVVLKKTPEIKTVFKDKKVMKYLIPASIVITCNWGLYIWAVTSGKVMDASLGYYMNPLAVFLCGIFVFREKCNKLELAALLLALVGVVLSTVQYGEFPFTAIGLAVLFAAYGVLKKFAHVDSVTGVFVETVLMVPFAIAFLLFAPVSVSAFSQATVGEYLLLAGAGIATALPMVLYSQGVNDLPFSTMGFLQYVSPTLMLLIGILQGEAFTGAQAISFGFIWAGLVLYTIGMVRREKARQLVPQEERANETS